MGQRIKLSVAELASLVPEEAPAFPLTQLVGTPEEEAGTDVASPGAAEVIGRAAGQGATLGFADELGAALYAGLAKGALAPVIPGIPGEGHRPFGELYTEARDEERAELARTREAHPYLSPAVEFVGALPLAIAAGGAAGLGGGPLRQQVGRTSLLGAAEGGVAAGGASDAETPGELATDVAAGTGLGLVAGPVAAGGQRVAGAAASKLAGRHQSRQTDKMLAGIPLERQKKSIAKGALKTKEQFFSEADKAGIANDWAAGRVDKAHVRIDAERERLGEAIGQVIGDADQYSEGIRRDVLAERLAALSRRYGAEENYPAQDFVEAEIERILTRGKDRPLLAVTTVHGMARRYGAKGFGGKSADVSQTTAAQVSRDMDEVAREVLADHLDMVAATAPEAVDAAGLRQLNAKFRTAKALKDLVEYRAERGQTFTPTLLESFKRGGLMSAVKGALKAGFVTAPEAATRGASGVLSSPGAMLGGVGPLYNMLEIEGEMR